MLWKTAYNDLRLRKIIGPVSSDQTEIWLWTKKQRGQVKFVEVWNILEDNTNFDYSRPSFLGRFVGDPFFLIDFTFKSLNFDEKCFTK